jgi:hypothetical protein
MRRKSKYPSLQELHDNIDCSQDLVEKLDKAIKYSFEAMLITFIRLTKPFEIKGDEEVALIISAIRGREFSRNGVRVRVAKGFYKKDEHFKQNGGKMRIWNREAVISKELKFIQESGSEVI